MKIFSKAFLVLAAVFVVTSIWIAYTSKPAPDVETTKTESEEFPVLSGDECISLGGEIINTLNEENVYTSDQIIGEVEGLRCPCVCVVKTSD